MFEKKYDSSRRLGGIVFTLTVVFFLPCLCFLSIDWSIDQYKLIQLKRTNMLLSSILTPSNWHWPKKMSLHCDDEGVKCKKALTNGRVPITTTLLGLILGTIGGVLFLVIIFAIIYMLCGKRYFLSRPWRRSRTQTHSSPTKESSMVVWAFLYFVVK